MFYFNEYFESRYSPTLSTCQYLPTTVYLLASYGPSFLSHTIPIPRVVCAYRYCLNWYLCPHLFALQPFWFYY